MLWRYEVINQTRERQCLNSLCGSHSYKFHLDFQRELNRDWASHDLRSVQNNRCTHLSMCWAFLITLPYTTSPRVIHTPSFELINQLFKPSYQEVGAQLCKLQKRTMTSSWRKMKPLTKWITKGIWDDIVTARPYLLLGLHQQSPPFTLFWSVVKNL